MERSVHEQLLYMLQNLGEEELKHFHWYLQNVPVGDFTTIRKCHLEKANRLETIDLMVQTYTTDHVIELATSILEMMSQGQSEKRDTQHSNAICRHNIILSFSEEPTQGINKLLSNLINKSLLRGHNSKCSFIQQEIPQFRHLHYFHQKVRVKYS